MEANKFTIGALVLAFFLLFSWVRDSGLKREIKQKDNLIESLESGIETWKNKDSLHLAKIKQIQTVRINDFLKIESSDSTISELQALVKVVLSQP